MVLYRMTVFPQIALAHALIGGGIAVVIRKLFPGERRLGRRAAGS